VLCQQALPPEAARRLERFREFMDDTTERRARSSEAALEAALGEVRRLPAEPTAVAVAVAAFESSEPDLAVQVRSAIETFKLRQQWVLRPEVAPSITPAMPMPLDETLAAAQARVTAMAESVVDTGLRDFISETATRRMELEARKAANAARTDIDAEVVRLKERNALFELQGQTDTKGITRKSSELAQNHVTAVVLDCFTREAHDLKLKRVTLLNLGGRKGQLMQRPSLLAARQTAEIPDVLSEGEQTALGLAGFLTEAHFDVSKSAIVHDDPVTSLDHIRRSHVAARLCDLAEDRQVVVFTHDLTFVGDLRSAAEERGVAMTERSVERHGDGSIGMCRNQHPWKAKDAKARIEQLRTDLQRMVKERSSWDEATYEERVAAWAGRLSETWERIISQDIANQLVDRGKSEVRPRMVRVLARFTDQDNKEFQGSYGRCSKWALRHDKSTGTNYVAPDLSELESELDLVQIWHERVRKYDS
jgi:hypothetical protein